MLLLCKEDPSLPEATIHASYHTALELREKSAFNDYVLTFDDFLPENLLLISSDIYEELREFLSGQGQIGDGEATVEL